VLTVTSVRSAAMARSCSPVKPSTSLTVTRNMNLQLVPGLWSIGLSITPRERATPHGRPWRLPPQQLAKSLVVSLGEVSGNTVRSCLRDVMFSLVNTLRRW
jgi:hypothetical protein